MSVLGFGCRIHFELIFAIKFLQIEFSPVVIIEGVEILTLAKLFCIDV